MYTRGRTLRFLRFTAVSAAVVLALTGFSTGRGHKSRSHHHSSGGGCSNSRQDHDSSSSSSSSGGGSYGGSASRDPYGGSSADPYGSGTSTGGTYRSRPTHRSTATGTARPLKDGTAVLVTCADPDDPYTTVEVANPNGREALFTVTVDYEDAAGSTLAETTGQVRVPANGRKNLRVAAASTGAVDRIDRCAVDRRAVADR